jgi:hypothetical protein
MGDIDDRGRRHRQTRINLLTQPILGRSGIAVARHPLPINLSEITCTVISAMIVL